MLRIERSEMQTVVSKNIVQIFKFYRFSGFQFENT
jgi:hypothetical protein